MLGRRAAIRQPGLELAVKSGESAARVRGRFLAGEVVEHAWNLGSAAGREVVGGESWFSLRLRRRPHSSLPKHAAQQFEELRGWAKLDHQRDLRVTHRPYPGALE